MKKIVIDPGTIVGTIVLFISTFILLLGIFNITRPQFIITKTKISKIKIVIYSIIPSIIFSILIAYISLKIDQKNAKRGNN